VFAGELFCLRIFFTCTGDEGKRCESVARFLLLNGRVNQGEGRDWPECRREAALGKPREP